MQKKQLRKTVMVALQSHTKGKFDIKYTKIAKKHNSMLGFLVEMFYNGEILYTLLQKTTKTNNQTKNNLREVLRRQTNTSKGF